MEPLEAVAMAGAAGGLAKFPSQIQVPLPLDAASPARVQKQ
jgi:hypothetical protein